MTENNKHNFAKSIKNCLCNLKSKIHSYRPSKPFIAILFFLIGIGSTVLASNLITQDKRNSLTKDQIQDYQIRNLQEWSRQMTKNIEEMQYNHFKRIDDLFNDIRYPFLNWNEIRKDMIRHKMEMDKIVDKIKISKSDNYYNNNYSNNSLIIKKEDKNNLYYQVNIGDFDKKDIDIKIDNRVLTISGKRNIKDKNERKSFQSSINFSYSFLIPQNVDISKKKIKEIGDQIIVIFTKDD